MWSWGKLGAFWGTVWGLLFGSAMMLVPGVGYFIFAGWVVAALEGAVIGGGLAAVAGALVSIGIPKDAVIKYETSLKAGSFLLMVHGTEGEVNRAKRSLSTTGATNVESFSSQPVSVLYDLIYKTCIDGFCAFTGSCGRQSG
jgi:hypothetical protein